MFLRIAQKGSINYLHQFGVSNTFIFGKLIELMFMEQPHSYTTLGEIDLACHLRNADYNLAQWP